jgi:uncharacterized protein YpmS
MGTADVVSLLIVLLVPTILIMYVTRRFLTFREKQLSADTRLAAEKAAQYAANTAQLEARVGVLEQIITDHGFETAAQIEALRDKPRLGNGDKVQ